MNKITGIDLSKKTFDVAFLRGDYEFSFQVFSNDPSGFEELYQRLDPEEKVVMEASGPYYLQLANFLYEKGIKVSVVNPLVIRRYSQMQMMRAKTDKKDAAMIASYGLQHNPDLWEPDEKITQRLKQFNAAMDLLSRKITALTNQKEALTQSGFVDQSVNKSLDKAIAALKSEQKKLEKEHEALIKAHYKTTYQSLKTIPGIGNKTAAMLIAITGDFQKFDHYKQLIAYVGFSPRIYQSGTSVNGKPHICKMGVSSIRKLLYLCSWAAKKSNRYCIELYNRLKQEGKPEKLIKVAIANKLLRQAFAIGKNQSVFDENYV